MASDAYRWLCPETGPAKPEDLAKWAVAELSDATRILVSARDLPALAATILAPRVALPEGAALVQPGTVWVEGM